MIKAVIFDAGGVLHFSRGSQSDDLKKELGLTDEQISRFYSHYVPLLGTSKLSEEGLWDKLSQDFGIRKVDPSEKLMTRAWENSLQKMPGMYELLDELKTLGMVIVLLTNVTPQFAEILENRGHYSPFNLKVLSCETGMWKPEAGIYKWALEQAGVNPNEAIFVDDLEKNVVAANNIGINGILFEGVDNLRSQLSRYINLERV